MDSAFIAKLREEEADLSRKLRAVRDMLAAYDDRPAREPLRLDLAKPAPPARPKVSIDGFSEYGRLIVAEAMRAMMDSPHAIKTRQLVHFMEDRGIAISGENKVNAVGALLYRSADIASHGKAGWSLENRDVAEEIVAKYGYKENGAAEAAPEAEEAPTSSDDSSDSFEKLLG